MIKNFEPSLIKTLRSKIQNELSSKLNVDIDVKFHSSEQYWKIPEFENCMFHIYSNSWISVKDISQCFDLNWHYSSVNAAITRKSIRCIFVNEDAIWESSLDTKKFLDEKITWAIIANNTVDLSLEYDISY